jgi:sugar O-acyltransferase (sialic acid O-acetyltransferase NeuD family)
MLSDVYDCINALGRKVTRIVLNEPEQKRERTKDFESRLRELNERPLISHLDEFEFTKDEEYFVVPTTPRKSDLIAFLKNNYRMQFSNLIHPTAYVSPYAMMGQGVYIGARSVIAPGAVLKDYVFVNRGVTVGHDTIIHDFVRLQPGSNIGGHVVIFSNAMIGMGANVIEELVIGKGAVVAAGAAVIRDVKEKTLVAGVPAVVKKVYEG